MDPKQQMLMAMGLGLLGGGSANFGKNLSSGGLLGMQAYNQAQQMQMREDEKKQQAEMRAMQMAQMKQAQEAQAAQQARVQQFMQSRPDLAQRYAVDPQGAMKAAFPDNKPQFKEVGGRLVRIEGDKVQEAYAPPEKPKDWQDPKWVETQMKLRRAGASNVTTNVMPPREKFKDSLALKKDFDGQPEVQGFKQVQGAWDQISTALQSPSPANDMAAATKFMKMLDPGSVVRESELMMAMQASGALDRFLNTADRVLKGHKLTPEQRKDFYSAGEALYLASKDRFGQTVQQYDGIAQQYGLDSRFIQNAKPRVKGGWGMRKLDD